MKISAKFIIKPLAHRGDNSSSIAISADEMTGIQALERIAPDLPMSPEKPLAVEFEYKRNGTQTLIAGVNIATGKVQVTCGETRKEEDFSGFIRTLTASNLGYDRYHIIFDQLNTHKSETLVRFTAEFCQEDELGIKGPLCQTSCRLY